LLPIETDLAVIVAYDTLCAFSYEIPSTAQNPKNPYIWTQSAPGENISEGNIMRNLVLAPELFALSRRIPGWLMAMEKTHQRFVTTGISGCANHGQVFAGKRKYLLTTAKVLDSQAGVMGSAYCNYQLARYVHKPKAVL